MGGGGSERLRLVGGLLEDGMEVVEILTFLGSCSCPHVLALLPPAGTLGGMKGIRYMLPLSSLPPVTSSGFLCIVHALRYF